MKIIIRKCLQLINGTGDEELLRCFYIFLRLPSNIKKIKLNIKVILQNVTYFIIVRFEKEICVF